MPLNQVIRHGFTFWEAPRCPYQILPELDQQEEQSTAARLSGAPMEYRRRARRDQDEPMISLLPATPADITNIQDAIVAAFGISREDFFGRVRTEKVSNARTASLALCRAYTLRTVEEIGQAHNRHHRVVCHASWRFAELQRNNPAFAVAVAAVESSLLQKAA